MAPLEQLKQLADELRQKSDIIVADLTTHASGAASLDVRISGRVFVLAYIPTYREFYVDQLHDEDVDRCGIGTFYRFAFEHFEPAKQKLISLMDE